MASHGDQLAAMTKTLDTLLQEREELVHETARLGQEVRQLRQAASGDAESQAAQVLMLKEIVAALTVRAAHRQCCRRTTLALAERFAPVAFARSSTARICSRRPPICAW